MLYMSYTLVIDPNLGSCKSFLKLYWGFDIYCYNILFQRAKLPIKLYDTIRWHWCYGFKPWLSAFIGQTKSIKPEEKKMNSSAAALGGCHSLVWHLLKVTLFVPIGIFKPTTKLYVKWASNYIFFRQSVSKLKIISSYIARITSFVLMLYK